MTDVEPSWEACRVCGGDHWTKDHAEAAAGPRDYPITDPFPLADTDPADAALRETFVAPGGKRIHVKFAEAAAGPRDEAVDAVLGILTSEGWVADPEATDYNLRVARLVAEAAAELRAAIEAEAAAGPRDEGLDVERLARAMQNVEDELTATNIAYEYAALAKASES